MTPVRGTVRNAWTWLRCSSLIGARNLSSSAGVSSRGRGRGRGRGGAPPALPLYRLAMPYPLAPPIEPMLAKAAETLPEAEGGGWLFEPKWDGFRALAFRDGDDLYLQSRELKPLDRYFPELRAPLLSSLPARCVVDGEIAIAGPKGLDFEALLLRIHPAASRVRLLADDSPASFVAFDLLALGDRDLRDAPLAERRELLERAPLREGALEGHPWRDWAEQAEAAEPEQRMPGGKSRWNRGKDMSWEPLRVERVCEVAYDHLQGARFRHATRFLRWRPDRSPASCRYDQLEVTPPFELAKIFGRDR